LKEESPKNGNVLEEKSYKFSIRIVRLSQYLNHEKRDFILSRQILRSGTAIGALVSESKYAQSRADFLNKLMIALKEANETRYWINLLHDTDYLSPTMYRSLHADVEELLSLLVSITKKLKIKTEPPNS